MRIKEKMKNGYSYERYVMYCPDCGNLIKPLAKFCENCGLKINNPLKPNIIEPSQISWASNLSHINMDHKNESRNMKNYQREHSEQKYSCEFCYRLLEFIEESNSYWCKYCQRYIFEPHLIFDKNRKHM